jgi:tRNA threonylcarbamoyl adenosine modification protein (Sua5/YciO/YrdC/YwlC family)
MVITIEDSPQFLNKVAATLRKGDIIALPTDTVYGLAVDGTNTDACEKLRVLKGRERKPFTFFISKSALREYTVITKQKIIDYFIPGPLTVILKKRAQVGLPLTTEKIGVRIPQVHFINTLLSEYKNPLAVTSANVSGQAPLTSTTEISKQFPDIDLIINGGQLQSRPSTVLDITTTPPTVKRKGKIPLLEIEKVYGKKVLMDSTVRFNVLFVCTANTCRSPLAEGIFKTMISEDYCQVKSAGIVPMDGLPPAQFSLDVVQEYGGSIAHHQTKRVTQEMIEWADLILVMEFNHYNAIVDIAREAAVKTFLLKEYRRRVKYNEVADPVGKDIHAYREAARDMLPSLKLIARDIKKRFIKENSNVK